MGQFEEHEREQSRLERIREATAEWPEAPTPERMAKLPSWASTYMKKLEASVQTLRAIGEGVGPQGLRTRVSTSVEAWGDGEGLHVPERSEFRFEVPGYRGSEITVLRSGLAGYGPRRELGCLEVRASQGRLVVVQEAGNVLRIFSAVEPENILVGGFGKTKDGEGAVAISPATGEEFEVKPK